MTILVTGFDPFGGATVNPAWEAARRLQGRPGMSIEAIEIPTEFDRAAAAVLSAAERLRPDAVVMLGQAGGRSAITPERVAINIMDARIPDNAGAQPVDVSICPQGPAAVFSTLPIKAMVGAMQEAGVAAEISNSAGTFVCNSVMYRVVNVLGERIPTGFIHVPSLPEQVGDSGRPAMALEEIVRGLEAALGALAE